MSGSRKKRKAPDDEDHDDDVVSHREEELRIKRRREREERVQLEQMKQEARMPGAPFGAFEREQLQHVTAEHFVANFSERDQLLDLEPCRTAPSIFSTVTAGMRHLFALQAAAEHRSLRMEQHLHAYRARALVFSFCPPFSFDLQTLSFTGIFGGNPAENLGTIDALLHKLERLESLVFDDWETSYDDRTVHVKGLIYAERLALIGRLSVLFQSWSDRKQQTAPLLRLLLPLHPFIDTARFPFRDQEPIQSLFYSRAPIEQLL